MMGTKRDYYEILGVQKTASLEDIKKIYRQLVLKYHPDRVAEDKKKEAEEKFKEISEAYAVLSDPQKRQLYDQYGHAGIDSRYSTEDIFRNADFSDIFKNMGNGGFGSFFEDVFSDFGFDLGTGTRGRRRPRGADINLEMTISLEEAAFGTDKEISVNRYENCSHCSGTGAQPGSDKITCSTCRGKGAVTNSMGFISFSQTCPSCGGQGVVIKHRCSHCSGEGLVGVKKNIKVTIPQGVDNGSVLRLKEEGHSAQGGRGDLFLHINVKQHQVFEREGDDIRSKVTISVLKAILGGEIEVASLVGKVRMKIPQGTQPGSIFRLKGKGIVNLRTKRLGDQLVEVIVDIPQKLSPKEKKILDEWVKVKGEDI